MFKKGVVTEDVVAEKSDDEKGVDNEKRDDDEKGDIN